MPIQSTDIYYVLKKYWGYDDFRPLQKDIILSVLKGEDTLGLLPTGGGKSLTFQIPGMCFENGLTIVVTPLISLMKDQVDNLNKLRIKATALHSGMTTKENRIAWEKIVNGNARFLYVSPEKLQNERFLNELRNLKINLITVDEAHCISQWGYDFRPSYLNIKKLRLIKPGVPVLALTATATPAVAEDIMKQLDFRSPKFYKKSFSRKNLNYIVRESDTKIFEVLHILSKTSGSAIVYVRSRKKTKEISDYLNASGITSTFYHAGLDSSVKTSRQNEWKLSSIRVMVATNAFGMGIDKPDVRTVIHYDMPPSLEEYYQEAGRAGRDGKKAYAVLLSSKNDKSLLRRRVTEAFPDRKIIKNTYENICNNLHISIGEGYEFVREFDLTRFCNLFDLSEKQCRASLRLLGQAGYMHFIEDAEKKSRLKINCEREELYDFHFPSDVAEKIFSICLRLYTGLFSEYVYISESEIADNINVSTSCVYETLLTLDKMKIITYIPRSGLPMIYFPTSREEKSSLIIGTRIYEERKKLLEQRTEAVIDYSFVDSTCRVRRMLSYFGEKDSEDCGNCDVCRSKNKKKANKSNESIIENIMRYLKDNPTGVRFLSLETKCGTDRATVSACLAFLCNEGFVTLKDHLYYPN